MDEEEYRAGDDLLAAFSRWAAAERVAEASAGRARERRLRQQAAAEATWSGVLVDLAEAGAPVTLAVGEERVAATVMAVGSGFVAVRLRSGRPALVALDGIAAVWRDGPGASSTEPAGSRFPAVGMSLTAALAALADERAPVRLRLAGGHHVDGELVSCGDDVLTLRTGAPAGRSVVHVPVAMLEICELA